jgi:transposase InsO family protein
VCVIDDRGTIIKRWLVPHSHEDLARRAVAGFIDTYNSRRRHSSYEMLPPVAYEQLLNERAATEEQEDRAA